MFKILSITLFVALSFQQNVATLIAEDNVLNLYYPDKFAIFKISSTWQEHVNDFIALIDTDKIVAVIIENLSDPEVLNFVSFIFSDDFKQVIWDFESISEFKEAFNLLADKGYDVGSILAYINNALDLPPFEKPRANAAMKGTGMTGLIEDLIAVLPTEEIKKLFESKLETSPEVRELFETINSPEFMDIMKRMSKNPEYERIKKIFEGYGIDFTYMCQLAKDFFGEYYQGVFCY